MQLPDCKGVGVLVCYKKTNKSNGILKNNILVLIGENLDINKYAQMH